MQVKCTRTVKQDVVEDIVLPCYSRHDLDASTHYSRLSRHPTTGVLLRETISLYAGMASKVDYERVAVSSGIDGIPSLGQDASYYLGEGDYASDHKEWNTAVRVMRGILTYVE